MNIKEFLKPGSFKIAVFLLVAIPGFYFAAEETCAVGFSFKMCYRANGFPLPFIVTGDTASGASDYLDTLPLGNYFSRAGNFLLNPFTMLINFFLIYLIACLADLLFKRIKSANKK